MVGIGTLLNDDPQLNCESEYETSNCNSGLKIENPYLSARSAATLAAPRSATNSMHSG